MRQINKNEIRNREIAILKYIKNICEENNLKYYLYAGTLVGALEYQDFLPTDDDIDIVLARPDYEKLLNLLKNNHKYTLFTPYENKEYYYPFAKLSDNETIIKEKSRLNIEGLGIHVDIFPMDGLPKYFKKLYLLKMRFLKKILLTKMVEKPKIKKIKHLYYLFKYYILIMVDNIFRSKENNYFALLIDKKSQKYNYENSTYISLINYGNRNSNYIDKDLFSEQKIYYFRDDYYTSSKNSETLIKKIYGNKKCKRASIDHGFVAFLK